jgi:hypothetical protein
MAERTPRFEHPDAELGNWGNAALSEGDGDHLLNARDLHTGGREYYKGSESASAKLLNPAVKKAIGAMLALGISMSALTMSYSESNAAAEAGMEQLDKESSEKIKKDLMERLAAENIDENIISEILNDPELVTAYEEMRKDGASFDEYIAERYPDIALGDSAN